MFTCVLFNLLEGDIVYWNLAWLQTRRLGGTIHSNEIIKFHKPDGAIGRPVEHLQDHEKQVKSIV